MNKVWFQLTGSHGTGQPQHVLHADGRFFIGGYHSLDAPNLKRMKEDRTHGRLYNFLQLDHTRQPVVCPLDASGYPEYSWWYDNKINGQEAFQRAQQIFRFDPEAHLIYFSAIPMLNTLILARLLKSNMPDKVTMIHYKRYFWGDQVKFDAGVQRTYNDNVISQSSRNAQHLISKQVQKELIDLRNIVYLSDSLHTKGQVGLDSANKITQITSFRDSYLQKNPKIKLFNMRNKIYEVYDNI